MGGTVQIASWKCNFNIYLDIQAITTLLCLLFLLYVHFSTLQLLSWKVTFSGIQNPLQPTVFNLQASDWVHCKEETGAYYQLYRHTYKLVIFLQASKVSYFAPQKYVDLKKIPKIYHSFLFAKKIIGHTNIFTECNDNFKFTISLKLNGAKTFIAVPPKACLFYITSFLYSWQKIFTNKNIF